MARRVCLSIGVSTVMPPLANEAIRFAYLDGAIFAARAIGEWAMASGFGNENVRVVDDDSSAGPANPVTRERVQKAVDELFPPGAEPTQQLVLAFCGHGLTDANVGAISWFFSDSLRQKYRVVADAFYTELLLHGVERITLITDACREAPQGTDLRLDPVRGIIVHGNQVSSPRFDRLAACQDGAKGYMVLERPGRPGKCVFSGVVVDALWGIEPAAIVGGLITTTTLASCVRTRAGERAKDYRLTLNPQCFVDPEPIVLYDASKPPAERPSLQAWPAAGTAEVLGGQAEVLEADEATQSRHKAAADMRRSLERTARPEGASLVVRADGIHLWARAEPERIDAAPGNTAYRIVLGVQGEIVVVEFGDGWCTPVVLYDGLFTVVTQSDTGEAFQAYGRPDVAGNYQMAIEAIDDFAAGRLGVDSIDRLAGQLRFDKHADPTLGAICAYLYRAVADFDSIRRMAFFYYLNGQPVPFDIALLGAMKVSHKTGDELVLHVPAVKERVGLSAGLPEYVTRATHAAEVKVGGRCPWLGLGWDYLVDPRYEWAVLVTGLARYADKVKRSGFTQFPTDVGPSVAQSWGLRRFG